MISTHIAALYQVEPRALIQAVKRNLDRFPRDFMFELAEDEFESLKSQIGDGLSFSVERMAPKPATHRPIGFRWPERE